MNSAKFPFETVKPAYYASETAKNTASQGKHRWPFTPTAPAFVLSSIAIEANKIWLVGLPHFSLALW
jgi:hypothetical protein